MELGCYFSINRQMLIKPARRALVSELPADRLLTETDGPFVRIEDRQVVPMDIENTVSALAAVCGVPEKEMATRLLRNLLALVS